MLKYFVLVNVFLCTSISGAYIHRRGSHNRPQTISGYDYETKYATQKIDHFSFGLNTTYKQRYLINRSHWKEGGPVFFYCGNEGDITWFCNNTGFMWDLAPEYSAMLVFAEHRYYGKSLPFGDDAYSKLKYLSYLTSEQALADFASLITELGEEYGNPPFVAFGGSYGGMLAAWLRMKYPSAVIGSIAASAPIWQFTGLTDCQKPFKIITQLIASYGSACVANVRNSWSALNKVAKSPGGLQWLEGAFQLCHPLDKNADPLADWLNNVWFDLAEVNYPYPASFLQPLPAWPMKVVCSKLSTVYQDNKKLLSAVAKAVEVYHNFTGKSSCLDVTTDNSGSLGLKGWDFQSCTEMVMPMCSDNVNDVFPKQPWVINDVKEGCVKKYNVTPLPMWVETQYGGKNITASTNIVFSNGEYDPWSAGGVTEQLTDSLPIVIIKDGGHHVDLRASNPADTDSIKNARSLEKHYINLWLSTHKSKENN